MKACLVVIVLLVSVSVAHPGHGEHGPHTHESPQPQRPSAVCSGLTRRTRTRVVTVPVLFNTQSGKTAPVPDDLDKAEPQVVEMMERDGWEVRTKRMTYSQPIYIRVRVCCPWDAACLEEQNRTPESTGVTKPRGVLACANGGEVIYENGLRVCDCPAGFTGPFCQIDASEQSPSAQGHPGMHVTSPTPKVIANLIRKADLMRQKMRNNPNSMMDQRQHLINSMAGPYGQNAAVWQQQMMREKMRQMCRMRKIMRFQRMQMELLRQMQSQGPYSGNNNMDNIIQQQQQLQQQQQQQQQGMYSMGQNMNSGYQATPNIMMVMMEQQRANQMGRGPAYTTRTPMQGPNPSSENPYNRVRPYIVRPLPSGPPTRGQIQPTARTPYDLDPFNRKPSLVSDPRTRVNMNREKTLVALALYEYMKSQQSGAGNTRGPGGYPGPVASPPLRRGQYMPRQPLTMQRPLNNDDLKRGLATLAENFKNTRPAPAMPLEPRDPISTNVVQQISYQGQAMQMPNQRFNPMPNQIPNQIPNQLPTQVPTQMPQLPNQIPNQVPTMPQVPTVVPTQIPQMPNMPNAPNMPQMPQGPDMQGRPQMPTEAQMLKMQQCKPQLEEGINTCLSDTTSVLSIVMFMNTDYMVQAKTVCENSEMVGGCFMRQDGACGEEDKELARQMIASVMQMMGMVCQQIMSGEAKPTAPAMPAMPAMPLTLPSAMPSVPPTATLEATQDLGSPPTETLPTGLPYRGSTNLPSVSSEISHEEPTPKLLSTEDTEIPSLPPTENPENVKSTTLMAEKHVQHSDPTASPAAMVNTEPQPAPSIGHDEALPVEHRKLIFGHPAWLVIALGVVLLLVIVLSILVCCLCCRRRKQKSMTIKEIERLPMPIDDKTLSIIGVPPPLYTTATVNQTCETKDDLSLPPIDLDYSTDSETDEKPPLDSEDDADDESDAKGGDSPVTSPRVKKGGKTENK